MCAAGADHYLLTPPGGHVALAEVAQEAVGVDAAPLNLPHLREMGPAVAAGVSALQAGAGPRVTTHNGADSPALGLFLCSWHSFPHTPRVMPDPCWPAALGRTGNRSPEVPTLGAVKLVAGVC